MARAASVSASITRNAAAKLGNEAVKVTLPGCVRATSLVQNAGPTGESHWYKQKPTPHAMSPAGRHAGPGERGAERVLVLRPARGDDDGVRAERGECARRVPRPAADARRGARDDVTREMPDHGERRHGSQA